MAVSCNSTPSKMVTIKEKKDGSFELLIHGKPVYIKGVGGTFKLDIAAQSGANAFRTWGGSVASIGRDLEKAREHNMYIMQGIGMTKDSASYHNEEYKNKMRESVKELATHFKDDPNIFIWCIGNEIDLGNANNEVSWSFVEELAGIIKSIDQNHLVGTVIAHNAKALEFIASVCPSLDMIGINSYGSIGQVASMVEKSSYKGAYMITEWGPTGFWERQKTSWGAPLEQTSEEKRLVYEERYTQHIRGAKRCLGSFVFLWGQKEERTPTWFSMFVEHNVEGLPLNGEKTPMVEAMQRVWNNREPEQTAPVIKDFTINGKKAIDNIYIAPNASFTGKVNATDKEGDRLTYVWEVLKEATVLGFGGSYEPRPDRIGVVVTTEVDQVELRIKEEGNYRLYVYVLDGTGFVATVNAPFQVKR
ncbi:MAG: beta-galactosidase [Bacteroidales bacterium]|nr:beta-galactosidase [Bacteroidales bacterium]